MKTPGRAINNSKENKADILAMSPKELELFTIMRNSMIEIFPYEDKKRKKFYDDTIVLSECFGIIAAKGLQQYIEREINLVKTQHDAEIMKIKTALAALGVVIP
jgi:hypothetical protein